MFEFDAAHMPLGPSPIVLETIKRYRRLVALLIAVGLIAASWLGVYSVAGDNTLAENAKTFWLTVASVLANLASTVIAFWVASMLFAREDEQQLRGLVRGAIDEALSLPTNLRQVRWVDLIDNASEIDFVVQGWNGWAEQADTARALTTFFERGGVFRLYVCDPKSKAASRARSLLEERIGRTPGEVTVEINGTYRSIKDARDQASSAGQASSRLEVHYMDRLNWYFAAFFKGKGLPGAMRTRDVFIFSIYSHTPRRKPWLMPALLTYPDLHEGLLDWFSAELDHLREKELTKADAERQPRTVKGKAGR